MLYILLRYGPGSNGEAARDDPASLPHGLSGAVDALVDDLVTTGEFVYAMELADPTYTQVVEISNGAVVVTDGTDTAATETLGGFGIIDVESHDRALEVAARSAAVFGRIELRPLGEATDGEPDG